MMCALEVPNHSRQFKFPF